MEKAVSFFLLRHGFARHQEISALTDALLYDMNRGLRGQSADEDMLLTWRNPPSKTPAGESVIVIDAGGTNFRSCLVTFDADGNAEISRMEKTRMPGVEREISRAEFFEQFARNLDHLRDAAESIGFCFSYPMKTTEDGDGVLLEFSKEVKAPEVVGCAIGKELREALCQRGWKSVKRVSMINDTVAALLAGAAINAEGKRCSSYIGFILGTGLNATYIQPAIEGVLQKQIIVCESGKFKGVAQSDFDLEVAKNTVSPSEFLLEKQTSGAYLGPLSLEALRAALRDGLFSQKFSEELSKIESLTLIDADAFLHEPFGAGKTLAAAAEKSATDEDRARLYDLLDAIMERSARNSAAILSAAVIQSGEGKNPALPVRILCNGSTYSKTHGINSRVHGYLEEELSARRGLHWRIVMRDNDITLGAAIAGLSD